MEITACGPHVRSSPSIHAVITPENGRSRSCLRELKRVSVRLRSNDSDYSHRENIKMMKLIENEKHKKLQRGEGDNEREMSGQGEEKEVQTKREHRKREISD